MKLNNLGQYMNIAQKGIRGKTSGPKQQLLVDIAVPQDSKSRQTKVSTTWIDYKKAYDSMASMDPGMLGIIQGQ